MSGLNPELLQAHKNYEAAINSNDTDTVMAMYDKDAEIFQPGLRIVSGLKDIRKWVADYYKDYTTHWVKKPLANFVFGDYGFDEGIDTAVDKPRKGRGWWTVWDSKGILIYKRQKDGRWLIFRDIWNDIKPPKKVRPKPAPKKAAPKKKPRRP